MTDKTPQLIALEDLQAHINGLPEEQRARIKLWAEEIRDILSEGQEDAFTALALVSCECGAVHAEQEAAEHDSQSRE